MVSVAVRMSNCGDCRVQLCSLILGPQLPFLLHYCPLMPNFKYPYKTVTLYQIESTHFKTQQNVMRIIAACQIVTDVRPHAMLIDCTVAADIPCSH